MLSQRRVANATFAGKLRSDCRGLALSSEQGWVAPWAGACPSSLGHWGFGVALLLRAESWSTAPLQPLPRGEGEHPFLGGYCHACIFLCWIGIIAWTKSTGQALWKEKYVLMSFCPMLCAPLSVGFIWLSCPLQTRKEDFIHLQRKRMIKWILWFLSYCLSCHLNRIYIA